MRKLLLAAGMVFLGATTSPVTVDAGAATASAMDACPPLHASAMHTPLGDRHETLHVELDPLDVARTNGTAATEVETAALEPTTIPVWFHVITNGPGTDVLDLQLEKQLEVMNAAFAGAPGGAATPFSFSHAGTDRTDSAAWYGFAAGSTQEREAKAALREGDGATLNIYVTKTSTGASWGTFPWRYKWNPSYDGVVLSRNMLFGGAGVGQNEGDVAVHEAGHWLGLYHTFQGYDFETRTGGGCAGEGDYVDDTPAEDTPAEACPVLRDTCTAPGADPIHNYMDYSADACKDQFTTGQVARMETQWTEYREPNGKN